MSLVGTDSRLYAKRQQKKTIFISRPDKYIVFIDHHSRFDADKNVVEIINALFLSLVHWRARADTHVLQQGETHWSIGNRDITNVNCLLYSNFAALLFCCLHWWQSLKKVVLQYVRLFFLNKSQTVARGSGCLPRWLRKM